MIWIKELDKHGHNVLIDELVWHLEQGRKPIEIALVKSTTVNGFEFRFEESEPVLFKASSDAIELNWNEAIEICKTFNQLQSLSFVQI